MNKPDITFPILGDDFIITAPNYFTIGGFKIYWYGVIIALAFVVAVIYCLARAEDFGLTKDNIYDMVIVAVPCAIVGCRAYYVVFNWDWYKNNIPSIFDIRNGGMGMYGGIILAVIGLFIYTRIKKVSLGAILDAAGLGLLIGQSIGRWGNFMNREAYGLVTDLPWKMGLVKNGITTYVHPTFLYESLWTLIGFLLLHFYSKKHRRFDGQIFALAAAWYGVARALLELLRTDSLYFFNTGIPSSQIVGVVSVIGCIVFFIIRRNAKPEELYKNRVVLAEGAEMEREEEAAGEADESEIGDEVVEIAEAADEESAAEEAPAEEPESGKKEESVPDTEAPNT